MSILVMWSSSVLQKFQRHMKQERDAIYVHLCRVVFRIVEHKCFDACRYMGRGCTPRYYEYSNGIQCMSICEDSSFIL